MANHAPRAGKRFPKTLIRELNEWLKPDGLQVVDWGRNEITPPPKHKRYFLETIGDDPDWDLLSDLEAFYTEMQAKHHTKNHRNRIVLQSLHGMGIKNPDDFRHRGNPYRPTKLE